MKKLLAATCVLVLITGLIFCIRSGSILEILLWATLCFFIVIALAALYAVLDNQQYIINQIGNSREEIRILRRQMTGDKVCSRCGKGIDPDLSSCPHCGSREFGVNT